MLLAPPPPKGMYRYIFEVDAFYMIQIVKTIKCKTIIEFSSLTKTVLAVLHIYNTCLSYKLQEDKVTDRKSLKYTRSLFWNTKEVYLWQLFLSLAWLLSAQLFWILEFKDSSLSQLAWIRILDLLMILSLTWTLKLNCIGTTLSLEWSNANLEKDRGLEKMSANWSLLERNRMVTNLAATISRTKWKSIYICFVQARKIGLEER